MDTIQNIGWSSLLIFQAVSYGSYTILVHLCEKNGRISFSATSMNLIIEFFKLMVSITGILMISKQKKFRLSSTLSFKKSILFSIPAFLYFINNNLAVYIQLFMDSTSYQILSNLKIFTTAILYYFIIGKVISKIKWFSISLLFISGILYSLANLKTSQSIEKNVGKLLLSKNFETKSTEIYITEIGLVMVCIYAFISGLSGVYNEYLLKINNSDSIFEQNFYLYSYGCMYNFIGFFLEKKISKDENFDFFTGFNLYTLLIIFTQVFNGFLMSLVMKYSSNITRLFVISSSLIVTTVLSVIIFSLKLNIYFYFCFSCIMFALFLYNFYE
ncbi:unnamed protein product [Brachionus calyciflorus]|uniref:Uncharacterized protein n=1 Tax=Brachionus calyciflorus TaxID=104777 RepID=A0A813RGK8_9BILA|nr:unnamed protein product [Brachionus calyciflorus]